MQLGKNRLQIKERDKKISESKKIRNSGNGPGDREIDEKEMHFLI